MSRARKLAGICALAVAVGCGSELRRYPGQLQDEDGRFLNQVGDIQPAGPSVTLPFFARRFAAMWSGREGVPERVPNDGSFLRANAANSEPTITWIGHSTLLVQMAHQTFVTDPIWSERASPVSFAGPKRMVEPGVAFEDLPKIDFVLVSHNHYDHLDLATLERISRQNPDARFFVPLGNGELLRDEGIRNVEELGWGDTATSGALTIHCLPSQHWSARGLFDRQNTLWASWAIIGPDERVYFGGDTGYFAGFAEIGQELGPFDVAALPIGAYLPREMMRPFHLSPDEAVLAGKDLGAKRMIGIHFGTFDLSDEPPDDPPVRFRAAASEAGYEADDVWILRVGETRTF